MDHDFVGSPSSRRISQVLLEVLDEQMIKFQHISSERARIANARYSLSNAPTPCPHTAANFLLNLFLDARFDGS